MGIPVLILGRSGSGKSASMRNFKTGLGIVNVLGKPLPFKNHIPNVIVDDYAQIKQILYNSAAPSVAIDDAGYLMTNAFMNGHAKKGAGNEIFAFYNKMADDFWDLIRFTTHGTPPERIVYYIMHEDKNDMGDIKPKTIGKMLDEKVCIEGMFTIVLRAERTGAGYIFHTQTSGGDVCKSPMGMFETETIENDLMAVDTAIRKYYNLTEEKTNVDAK